MARSACCRAFPSAAAVLVIFFSSAASKKDGDPAPSFEPIVPPAPDASQSGRFRKSDLAESANRSRRGLGGRIDEVDKRIDLVNGRIDLVNGRIDLVYQELVENRS